MLNKKSKVHSSCFFNIALLFLSIGALPGPAFAASSSSNLQDFDGCEEHLLAQSEELAKVVHKKLESYGFAPASFQISSSNQFQSTPLLKLTLDRSFQESNKKGKFWSVPKNHTEFIGAIIAALSELHIPLLDISDIFPPSSKQILIASPPKRIPFEKFKKRTYGVGYGKYKLKKVATDYKDILRKYLAPLPLMTIRQVPSIQNTITISLNPKQELAIDDIFALLGASAIALASLVEDSANFQIGFFDKEDNFNPAQLFVLNKTTAQD